MKEVWASWLVAGVRRSHLATGAGLIAAGKGGGGSSLDWPSLAVSIVAAAIAMFAVIYSVKYTHAAQDSAASGDRSASAAERAAAAAEQQSEIQLAVVC